MGKPDWSFWGRMTIKPWQGCALSLDLDPDEIKIDPNSWTGGPGTLIFVSSSFPSQGAKSEFDKRLRLVLANISSFQLKTITGGNPGLCELTVGAD